jgi:hypothetical protein
MFLIIDKGEDDMRKLTKAILQQYWNQARTITEYILKSTIQVWQFAPDYEYAYFSGKLTDLMDYRAVGKLLVRYGFLKAKHPGRAMIADKVGRLLRIIATPLDIDVEEIESVKKPIYSKDNPPPRDQVAAWMHKAIPYEMQQRKK